MQSLVPATVISAKPELLAASQDVGMCTCAVCRN